jgi:hypothetical protein
MNHITQHDLNMFLQELDRIGSRLRGLGIEEIKAKLDNGMFEAFVNPTGGHDTLTILTEFMVWSFQKEEP